MEIDPNCKYRLHWPSALSPCLKAVSYLLVEMYQTADNWLEQRPYTNFVVKSVLIGITVHTIVNTALPGFGFAKGMVFVGVGIGLCCFV